MFLSKFITNVISIHHNGSLENFTNVLLNI